MKIRADRCVVCQNGRAPFLVENTYSQDSRRMQNHHFSPSSSQEIWRTTYLPFSTAHTPPTRYNSSHPSHQYVSTNPLTILHPPPVRRQETVWRNKLTSKFQSSNLTPPCAYALLPTTTTLVPLPISFPLNKLTSKKCPK